MTPEILLVFAIAFAAAVLLVSERLPADVVALLTLVLLGLTGLVRPDHVFSGFSQSAVITILSFYIVTSALDNVGVTRLIGQRLLALSGDREITLVPAVMVAGATLSLLMNNIAAGAVLLPAVVGISRESGVRPSKLLMPLAFSTLLGGMATLFTTSNIVVGNALREAGLRPFSIADFVPMGLPMALAGIAYMTFLGRRWLPDVDLGVASRGATPEELADCYGLKEAVRQITIRPGSPMAGSTLAQGGWNRALALTVLGVVRGGAVNLAPGEEYRVREGDVVLAQGYTDDEELASFGLALSEDSAWNGAFATEQAGLVEVVLSPRSEFVGKSLGVIDFRKRLGLTVLSVWRKGVALKAALEEIPLEWGDALLVLGSREKLALLSADANVVMLQEMTPVRDTSPAKAAAAVVITTAAIVLAEAGVLPLALAVFAAAVALILSGCITGAEAYRSVDWRSIFLIAGFIPLGMALESTGAAHLAGQALVGWLGQFGPTALALGLFAAAALLLQVLGNVATAVVCAPIAIAAAEGVGADPRGFAMAVALGTSMAFLVPTGHPVNVLVMGPGGYRVRDYLRVGWGLMLLLLAVVAALWPLVWGR